jgi:hypothetical protein
MPLRGFLVALAICWCVLGAAAWPLARWRHIPAWIAVPVALAFLTEISFYVLPGFCELREWIATRFRTRHIALALAATALLPYLIYSVPIYSLPAGHFAFERFFVVALLMAAVSFWYVPVLDHPVRDLLFLTLLAFVILSGIFKWIYPAPLAKLPMEVLGHLTLVRCAVFSVLVIKREKITFGFIPTLREVGMGALWAVVCTAVAFPVGLVLGQLHFSKRAFHPLQTVLELLGIFWFVALSEEFFFRALLQRWISEWTRNSTLGLLIASSIYGFCHLKFPNWRFAILAGILGLFCGIAFQQSRSMRASMITHTLVAGAFRLLLS